MTFIIDDDRYNAERVVTDNSKVNINLLNENEELKKKNLSPSEVDLLQFIYDRMECVHEENVNFDYMLGFEKILKKLK